MDVGCPEHDHIAFGSVSSGWGIWNLWEKRECFAAKETTTAVVQCMGETAHRCWGATEVASSLKAAIASK